LSPPAEHFAAMANISSHLGCPDACSRLLRILVPGQADALLDRAQRWPSYSRMRKEIYRFPPDYDTAKIETSMPL
jgi:hypothetical protein